MKNLANILRRSDITPRERMLTLVRNDVEKDKNGKGILSESEIYSLTQGWKPKTSQEAREYNKYLELSKIESSMRLDAQMFACRSENLLLRSHILVEGIKGKVGKTNDAILDKYIPREDALNFVIQNTYLDYSTLIHILTFNNLSKDIQDDLILLDEYVAHDKKYMEDEVFLYELFKDSKFLSTENKEILINRIYSCMYHDSFRKMKNGTEKDGFLLFHFFAELPMEAILKRWAEYVNIDLDGKDNEKILDELEKNAKDRDKTMEVIIRETLSKWIDDGLFVSEYTPIFFSDNHNTWNSDTKLTHKEVFARWYEELKNTKVFIDKIVKDGDLMIEQFNKDIFGVTEKIKIITGESLYNCKVDIDFVNEYKEQIKILLPLAGMCLFIEKYNKPLENLKTLKCFSELSKTFSDLFEVDMSEKYSDFVNSFEQDIKLINQSIATTLDNMNDFIYTKRNKKYLIEIIECAFKFNTEDISSKRSNNIIDMYNEKIKINTI